MGLICMQCTLQMTNSMLHQVLAADALRPRVWGQLGWPIRPRGPKPELNLDFKCYYQVRDHYQLNTRLNIAYHTKFLVTIPLCQ
jgi:hypothetical protein